jgi:hypothetical protein
MADICLKKILPYDLTFLIHKLVHKKRLKLVNTEFFQVINLIFNYGSIKLSGGIGYMTSIKFNNKITFGTPSMSFLTNLMWYEFWTEFTNLHTYPKRNLSPMLAHKITHENVNDTTPFKTTSKKWFS